ncbi:IclR family transcriptional regulator C-terminal domain-containing protein [Serratia ureilytica]
MRTRAYIGQHMPLYCSAMGKIFMAYGNDDYPAHYWQEPSAGDSDRGRAIPSPSCRKCEELADIRQRGMAMDREENELGVSLRGGAGIRYSTARAPCGVCFCRTAKLQQIGVKSLIKPVLATAQRIAGAGVRHTDLSISISDTGLGNINFT